ncbi:hypothetical protein HDU97_008251 [Phlyctochytrium planicorne]|nr:hypothetical protein HDU97_008251 [Phlyctochytrium planicorne]
MPVKPDAVEAPQELRDGLTKRQWKRRRNNRAKLAREVASNPFTLTAAASPAFAAAAEDPTAEIKLVEQEVELNELLDARYFYMRKKLGLPLKLTDEVQAAMDQEQFYVDNVEAVGIYASLVIVRLRSLVVGDEDEMMVHLHMVSKLQSLVYHGIACPQTLAYALLLLFRYYTRIKRDLEKISKNGWGERAEAFRQVIREQDIEKMFLAALTLARWQCIKDMNQTAFMFYVATVTGYSRQHILDSQQYLLQVINFEIAASPFYISLWKEHLVDISGDLWKGLLDEKRFLRFLKVDGMSPYVAA